MDTKQGLIPAVVSEQQSRTLSDTALSICRRTASIARSTPRTLAPARRHSRAASYVFAGSLNGIGERSYGCPTSSIHGAGMKSWLEQNAWQVCQCRPCDDCLCPPYLVGSQRDCGKTPKRKTRSGYVACLRIWYFAPWRFQPKPSWNNH